MPDAIATPILDIRDLRVHFPARRASPRVAWPSRSMAMPHANLIRAVDGVSLSILSGSTFGLVGESGCGKTTLSRAILRLIPATSGRVLFEGRDLFSLDRREMRETRRRLQIIFQDPASSLNPRLTIDTIVGEALHVHRLVRSARERRDRVAALLTRVGLPADSLDRYPHEFSGGQRQRIGIARALALEPRLIICDEPVSALDVSVQAQILNLLRDLQRDLGLTYLFISHHLGVIRHMCDHVAVMRSGQFVEQAPAAALFANPQHPYTQSLLAAIPHLHARSLDS